MVEENKTILELVRQSARKRNVGEGVYGRVYNLAGPEFSDYIVKIDRKFIRRLKETSSLVPVDYYDTGQPSRGNVAPVMLTLEGGGPEGEGLEIQLKERGLSIQRLQEKFWNKFDKTMSSDLAAWMVHAEILEIAAQVPDQEYVNFLDSMNAMRLLGHCADFVIPANNIMLSRDSLRLIDIGRNMEPTLNNLEDAKSAVLNASRPRLRSPKDPAFESVVQRIDNAEKIISKKFDQAASRSAVLTPRNRNEARALAGEPSRIVFYPGSSVEGMAKIPLSASPAQLRKTLTEMEKRFKLELPRS